MFFKFGMSHCSRGSMIFIRHLQCKEAAQQLTTRDPTVLPGNEQGSRQWQKLHIFSVSVNTFGNRPSCFNEVALKNEQSFQYSLVCLVN